MKTIIYLGAFELPDKNAAAHRVLNNAKALRELGYNIVFIDTSNNCSSNILNTKEDCFGFEKYTMKHTYKRLISIIDFLNVYKSLNGKIYGVIAYNYPSIALLKLYLFCKKKKIKIYADSTEWYGFVGESLTRKFVTGIDSFLRMNIVQPKLDGIIAISKYLFNYYSSKLDTIYIPPLVDITESKWLSDTTTIGEKVKIVYAGSPGIHKDRLNIIIDSLVNIDFTKVSFTILGITKQQFLDYYPQEKEKLGLLGENVEFLGRVSHDSVIPYINNSDYSMFYRDITRVSSAGFPTKFAESITCGTPVITNPSSDLVSYLKDGKNGYFISKNNIVPVLEYIINNHISLKGSFDRTIFDYNNYIVEFKKMFN